VLDLINELFGKWRDLPANSNGKTKAKGERQHPHLLQANSPKANGRHHMARARFIERADYGLAVITRFVNNQKISRFHSRFLICSLFPGAKMICGYTVG